MGAPEEYDHNLTLHPPSVGGGILMGLLREDAKVLAAGIVDRCPRSRERSLALTKLEEAVMWAIAAIARDQPGVARD